MPRYIARVEEDLDRPLPPGIPAVHGRLVDSIYLGGGTPSLLPPGLLAQLFAALRRRFHVVADAEITVECAPGQLDPAGLDAMLGAGVNRVSFGVQSFVDEEARASGRLHTAAIALADIHRVRRAGVARINADLIAGLPLQTFASWKNSLATLTASGVDHASVYLLEVDEDSRLGLEILNNGSRYNAARAPSDDEAADFYLYATEHLAAAGFAQYEISNFARPGCQSRHNLKYWLRQPCLGLGLDAHSMLHDHAGAPVRFSTAADLTTFLEGTSAWQVEPLGREDMAAEAWFLGLRRNAGIELAAIVREFGSEAVARREPVIQRLSAQGLLARQQDTLRLTPRGRLLSNEVFAELL